MRSHSKFVVMMATSCILPALFTSPATATTITIPTVKDNTVYSNSPATSFGSNTLLDATTSDMSYMMFDLNAIATAEGVPATQILINSAAFKALDYRTSNNGTNILYLANASGGWTESAFTWNDAVASYGATGGVGTADLDASKRLWEGRVNFGANTIVDVTATSQAPSTDASLASALQTDLSSSDGQVVFVMRGQAGSTRYTTSKENLAVDALPPRLTIDYAVIPEPCTTVLLSIGILSGIHWRRRSNFKCTTK